MLLPIQWVLKKGKNGQPREKVLQVLDPVQRIYIDVPVYDETQGVYINE